MINCQRHRGESMLLLLLVSFGQISRFSHPEPTLWSLFPSRSQRSTSAASRPTSQPRRSCCYGASRPQRATRASAASTSARRGATDACSTPCCTDTGGSTPQTEPQRRGLQRTCSSSHSVHSQARPHRHGGRVPAEQPREPRAGLRDRRVAGGDETAGRRGWGFPSNIIRHIFPPSISWTYFKVLLIKNIICFIWESLYIWSSIWHPVASVLLCPPR